MSNFEENFPNLFLDNEAFENDVNMNNGEENKKEKEKEKPRNIVDLLRDKKNKTEEIFVDNFNIAINEKNSPSLFNKNMTQLINEAEKTETTKDKPNFFLPSQDLEQNDDAVFINKLNTNFENMSLSNFKIPHNFSDDRSSNIFELKRNLSHSTILEMKKSFSELSIQTGRNFQKTSTFVISPKSSNAFSDTDDTLNIKLLKNRNVPELFIEFDNLYLNKTTKNYYWIEKSRWLKFEEDYNPDTKRFDSPHLSPLSIKGVSNFRKLFLKGEVVLDCHNDKFINILNNISESIIKSGTFTDKEISDIRNALIMKHYHAGEMVRDSITESSMYRFDVGSQSYQPQLDLFSNSKREGSRINKPNYVRLDKKLAPGTEALSVQVGALQNLKHTFSLFVRLNSPIEVHGLNEVHCPLRFIFIVFGPKADEADLIEVGRAFCVMMSNRDFREVGYSADCKEKFLEATKNFVTHSVLVPLSKMITHESLAAMLPQMKHYLNNFLEEQHQRLFSDMKKEMSNKHQDISVSQFENDVRKRYSITSQVLSKTQMSANGTLMKENFPIQPVITLQEKSKTFPRLYSQLCPPFKHFFMDWEGLKKRYCSDYRDAFTKDNAPIVFIGMIFIYFVVMAPAITFGALLNDINPTMSVPMMFFASGFFQFFYTFCGGQPLEIVGITGPVYAVEKVLGALSKSMDIELGAMRFWIGVYVALFGLIFTASNGVVIIKHIRISVEEIYNFLVSAIFILSALFNMLKALPYTMTPLAPDRSNIDVIVKERLSFGIGGATLFLAFFMANFCLVLVGVKRSSFFRRRIRNMLGSLNVPLGILLIIAAERVFFSAYSMPTLKVPASSDINFSLWFNIPSMISLIRMSPQAHGLCFAISISLFAILTCEISTNSILSTKSERRLMKPSLYSINYFYILTLFPLISGILGWPFISGAPVRTHAHCTAMSIWSINVPGVPSKIIGAVEQRISGIFVGTLVMLSVFFGTVLQFIPMAAMHGMFLYMGIMGSSDLIFIRRIINMLQRRKYWGSHDYLKDYPTWNIMALVTVQLFFVVILIVLNCISEFTSISWTPLLFPVTILVFGFVRGYVLPKWSRLNTHLSKMDKKHEIKLYGDHATLEKVFLTLGQNGVNVKVVQLKTGETIKTGSDSGSDSEDKSDLW